ncbi:MAG: putative metalloprotease CJM1_0395 family protein [Sulfurimonas sp.]|nr:putative metalloprotease CJM1_0395 family protein [Sulfurimonas sp.]
MNISSNTLYSTSTNYQTSLKPRVEEAEEEKSVEKKSAEEKKPQNELSADEKRLVLDLQSRDAEVRAHEAAHQSGGAATGGASYTYQKGPDGRMYAIGGEVSISYKSGSTPQETIANADAVIAAALAPANPSGQDLAVASSANMMKIKAQQQLAQETQEKLTGKETYKNEADKNSDSKEEKGEGESKRLDIPA